MDEVFVQVKNYFIQMNQELVQVKKVFIQVYEVLVHVKNHFIHVKKVFIHMNQGLVQMNKRIIQVKMNLGTSYEGNALEEIVQRSTFKVQSYESFSGKWRCGSFLTESKYSEDRESASVISKFTPVNASEKRSCCL
jgi:hypothetical protein